MATTANPSLWWKLSWRLSLVITAVVAAVIVGLCFWATTIRSPNFAVEREIGSVMAEAVQRDGKGGFVIADTQALRDLKRRNSRLWYVVATRDGASVSHGVIPAPYAGLAALAHVFQAADIRGATATDEIASVERVDTAAGEVRILFGGFAHQGWPVLAFLIASYPIYVPLIVLSLPAIFLTVPRIVRRSLARVDDVARKAAEIEPQRHGARLPVEGIPREVAPLVVAFNGALDRLEAEFEKRRRFLVDAAHELRTPIAIMQTRIDGMAEGAARTTLLKDVARLAETAEQLLDFERNDQGTDQHELVDLVEIARMVVADLAPLAIAGGYQISFQSEVERLQRMGSPTTLPRAIGNLVRNAIEHGGNAGTITVAVSGGGEIEVADEGPGIAPEHRELVFEPFYRVAPKSIGAGLGLSLVKQIVAHHGGRIILESGAAGTRVAIRIP
ncbi:HAMP domain-containing sensor histidine kinase [Phyllobacterium sp. 0TCS1.6C]|uniref:sensor histidine kinase n=1 Tax=unclassified Phyllobacterium TaxID=2638441 RepID=UPI002264B77F|nr:MULTISPECIES: HAMP domain-containing sensor histidine kinase [unclassified Phyllobacterium]MCX8282532.1 HAMP domain-containing sensor histidine kinase [Phyllobacterium sp. 0TCS1.6C]MCX8296414.1 HAMP domain-containing sensor histidine kinase [Phyllobacterium sp. 0TCS1.6A]